MNRRTLTTIAFCGGLLAAAAFVPTAVAGNVSWGVSVGGPGYNVSVGQPAYYGGRGYVGAPHFPNARHYYRPYYRPYFPSAYRPVVIVPPVAYVTRPMVYPYYAPIIFPGRYSPR